MSKLILKQLFKRTEFYLFGALLALSAVITAINPSFVTPENLFSILKNYSFLGILTLGELVVLIAGGIDVSFTAIATVAQYIMGVIIGTYGVNDIAVAILIPILIGAVLGSVNAIFVYYTRVHPVIITIATLNAFYGLLVFITGGRWIYNLPPSFRNFASLKILTFTNPNGISYGLSIFTGFWILTAILTWLILKYFSVGRKIYAVGGNLEAARRAGFSIFRVQLFVYSYMGALAGLGGFVQAQLGQIIQPNAIVGRELDTLAAAILGGASIFGGVGTVLGAILGVLLIAVVKNGLVLMKVSSYWHQAFIGLIIIIAVSITAYQHKIRAERMTGRNVK